MAGALDLFDPKKNQLCLYACWMRDLAGQIQAGGRVRTASKPQLAWRALPLPVQISKSFSKNLYAS